MPPQRRKPAGDVFDAPVDDQCAADSWKPRRWPAVAARKCASQGGNKNPNMYITLSGFLLPPTRSRAGRKNVPWKPRRWPRDRWPTLKRSRAAMMIMTPNMFRRCRYYDGVQQHVRAEARHSSRASPAISARLFQRSRPGLGRRAVGPCASPGLTVLRPPRHRLCTFQMTRWTYCTHDVRPHKTRRWLLADVRL